MFDGDRQACRLGPGFTTSCHQADPHGLDVGELEDAVAAELPSIAASLDHP